MHCTNKSQDAREEILKSSLQSAREPRYDLGSHLPQLPREKGKCTRDVQKCRIEKRNYQEKSQWIRGNEQEKK
jgi:hypothetical protein